jgi:hypothetical protein
MGSPIEDIVFIFESVDRWGSPPEGSRSPAPDLMLLQLRTLLMSSSSPSQGFGADISERDNEFANLSVERPPEP